MNHREKYLCLSKILEFNVSPQSALQYALYKLSGSRGYDPTYQPDNATKQMLAKSALSAVEKAKSVDPAYVIDKYKDKVGSVGKAAVGSVKNLFSK